MTARLRSSVGQNYAFHTVTVVEGIDLAYEVGIEEQPRQNGDATDRGADQPPGDHDILLEDGKKMAAVMPTQ